MKNRSKIPKPNGFALVVTLSLMILLTVIAVGLLSLSSISLRSSGQANALATAKSNARLALMLAIGELQKSLGPDKAITANSEILSATPAKPNTTGVWASWNFDPSSSSLDYSAEKTSRFRSWLVSAADPTLAQNRDFANQAWTGKTIELVGANSLGGGTILAEQKSTAGLVPVSRNGKVAGSYAWHVSDESEKARINLYRDPSQNKTLAQKRAFVAGHRPDPSVIKGPNGNLLTGLPTDLVPVEFAKAKASVGKIIDLDQAELLDQAKGKIRPFRNDITPYSLGLMTDVRNGGLKQDLSSMFEMGSATANTLPADFTNKRLYASTLGSIASAGGVPFDSDPNWSALAGYYNSFRSLTSYDTSPAFAMKPASTFINPVPVGYNPAPVIAKIDTIFSLVGRPLSDIWWAYGGGAPGSAGAYYDYCVNLIFTPVVTLHNPYNVNISFQQMQVTFTNIPVAFNFMFRSGDGGGFTSQGTVPGTFEALNTMAYGGHFINGPNGTRIQVRNNKSFVMNIANWQNSIPLTGEYDNDPNRLATSGPIILKPGQTLVCGPFFDPLASFQQDAGSGENTVGFDWQNTRTSGLTRPSSGIKAKPSFTPGLGFEVYAVTPGHQRFSGGYKPAGWQGHPFMMLRDVNADPHQSKTTTTDQLYMEFKIQRPSWYLNDSNLDKKEAAATFDVTAQIQTTNRGSFVDLAKLQFDYNDDSSLKAVFNDRVFRYPPTGFLTGAKIAAPGGVPYSAQNAYVQQFAIFSAYARTTNGGVYETGLRTKNPAESPQINLLKDGRLAGKPFLFHNPANNNATMNLVTEKPGVQPYEINFQPFLGKGDYEDYMDVDATNRVPALTGNKTTSGIKSGSYFELPSGPLQTIADFRRSNALSTSFQPYFVQPVGNSLLHPLMSANKVIESNLNISPTPMLDHSVLANHALYDRFYFSTFATRGTTTPGVVFEQFMNGTAPLASQAFQPYLPNGKSVAMAKDELFAASGKPNDSAYKAAAEYQLIRGPFNVNSTSVQAWKAVLASTNKSDVAILWERTAGLETRATTGAPILAMSMVNGGPISSAAVDSSKIDSVKTNNWNGYRELTGTELDTLAVKIVDEVRIRGPFLSMSEFVNRRIGPVGPLTLRGALETAIANAEINETQNATSADSFLNQVPIEATDVSDITLYNYKTPEATTGNPAAGAPGWVNQGDLMRILEPSATVRGDTFVIRVYGEAKDNLGNVIAHAYAEAVVQRVPEYLNPVDPPSLNADTDASASPENKLFGRQMKMVSFRWLTNNEI